MCLRLGLSATAAFIVLGGLLAMRTPPAPDAPPALFRLLAQQKYPASQLFLLMTLGPLIALIPVAERAHAGYMWSLGLLYLVWALVLPVLYVACRSYARVKATHSQGLLRYI